MLPSTGLSCIVFLDETHVRTNFLLWKRPIPVYRRTDRQGETYVIPPKNESGTENDIIDNIFLKPVGYKIILSCHPL